MRAFLLLATTLLSACVLHSETPIFTDAQAVSLFGAKDARFTAYDRTDGAWVAMEDPTVAAKAAGHHYLVADPSDADPARTDSYYFIPLDATRYVVQAVTEGAADYAIATWDGRELLASPLDCDKLKTSLKTNAQVMFLNDSCALRPSDTPPLELFATLAQRAGAPTLRFVKQ